MSKWFLRATLVAGLLAAPLVPVHAQTASQIELACPAGTSPLPGGTTVNNVTGKFRQNTCVDVFGNVYQNFSGSVVANSVLASVFNNQLYIGAGTNWIGPDLGQQAAQATSSASCGSTGCNLWVVPQNGGYNFSTPMSFTTAGKLIGLLCGAPGGTPIGPVGGSCKLNYTPTNGTAITFDYAIPSGFGGASYTVIKDIALANANCTTLGGCGGSAVGIQCGNTNSGCGGGIFDSVNVSGFGSANIQFGSNNGWGITFRDVSSLNSPICLNQTIGAENIHWKGGKIEDCTNGMNILSEVYGESISLDGNVNSAVTLGGSATIGVAFSCVGCHFENTGCTGTSARFITGVGNLSLSDGSMQNDCSSGNITDFIDLSGFSVRIEGLHVSSTGQTATQILLATGSVTGHVEFLVDSPQFLAVRVGGAAASSVTDTSFNINNSNGVPTWVLAGALAVRLQSPAPGGIASASVLWHDNVTNTVDYNSNNNVTAAFTGAWNCTSLTPVTVNANVATDQNLLGCSVPFGTFNRVGRTFDVWISGIYSTPAASTTAIVVKLKLGSVTLATWTSTALAGIQATNDQFNVAARFSVATAGASSVFQAHGNLVIDLGVGNTVADSVFADVNTGSIAGPDLTATQTLQWTIAFTVANASNSATANQQVTQTIN